MLKAYKYRIYPNTEQKIQIAKTFGCCRFVYNRTLAYRKEMYEKEKKSVSRTECNNYCNRELKKENEWLREVDKFALTNAIYNMDSAYQKFFKEHAGYPKFKSKHDSHRSYTTNFTNGNIEADFEENKVKLPKLKKVKANLHRRFSGQIKLASVSQVPSGKYYVSLLVETEHEELVHTNNKTGIDLGIKDLCITSGGKKYENPKIIKKYEKKLVKLQRKLSHKEKRSLNTQYRMPALIGTMVSELFYNGELLNGENTISKKTIFHKKNLVFYDMSAVGEYKESVENKNVYNKYEAAFVCKLIRNLREKEKETKIAVITPYKGQKRKILTRMLQEEINTKLTVCDTVDSFQGDEAEVVIFCMTRSQKPTRYFNDNRRLNVAFSRAKNELIIIGNRKYFKKFNSEKSVMPQIGKYIYEHGQIIVEHYDETLVNKKLNNKKMVLNLSSIIIDQEYDGNINDSKVDKYLEEYYKYNKITSPIRVKRVENRYYLAEGIEIYTACELMEQQECCCIEIE